MNAHASPTVMMRTSTKPIRSVSATSSIHLRRGTFAHAYPDGNTNLIKVEIQTITVPSFQRAWGTRKYGWIGLATACRWDQPHPPWQQSCAAGFTQFHRNASSSICECSHGPQPLHENETPHDADEDKSEDEILSGERFEVDTDTKNMSKTMDIFTVVTTSNGRRLIPALVHVSAVGETWYAKMDISMAGRARLMLMT